jgi:hypothetical protein
MTGPASRRAVDPDALVQFITAHESYRVDGTPQRRRLYINGVPVSDNDARTIRRWRAGKIEGVTIPAAAALLRRYGLTPFQFAAWCGTLYIRPTLRGSIRASD